MQSFYGIKLQQSEAKLKINIKCLSSQNRNPEMGRERERVRVRERERECLIVLIGGIEVILDSDIDETIRALPYHTIPNRWKSFNNIFLRN